MRFDDRLRTVLDQPATDRHDSAVRWRQLVELVARSEAGSDTPLIAEALDVIGSERGRVAEDVRAAAARSIAGRSLPFALLKVFASDRLAVCAPILPAAKLDGASWRALMDVADQDVRRFIAGLNPGLEPAPGRADAAPRPEQPAPSLHDVVERIERRRRARAPQPRGGDAATAPRLFRWETGPGGEIAWVDGVRRGAVVGRSLARPRPGEGHAVDEQVGRAFMVRAPFTDATLVIAGDSHAAGEWKISGAPAFDPRDGRFAGYRGVAVRPESSRPEAGTEALLADPDSVRELVHELKTPLNAIMGFAEIIDGQFLGPADRPYRERAAEIVDQAGVLLAGINDLDLAAKVRAAAGERPPQCDLGAMLEQIAQELREIAARREVELDFARGRGPLMAAVDPELAERLIKRLVASRVELAEPGERLRITGDLRGGGVSIHVSGAGGLRPASEEALLGTAQLKLLRGLARLSSADLQATATGVALLFQSR